MLASGIKGIRIQLSEVLDYLNPFSCCGVLDAPQLAARVRRRRSTSVSLYFHPISYIKTDKE
jgi:hypothetical protein